MNSCEVGTGAIFERDTVSLILCRSFFAVHTSFQVVFIFPVRLFEI